MPLADRCDSWTVIIAYKNDYYDTSFTGITSTMTMYNTVNHRDSNSGLTKYNMHTCKIARQTT